MSPLLEKEISLLPSEPGVYLMKDAEGRIIYVGKAKNLQKRVSQYFLREQEGKVAAMVSHVHSFDYIIVHTDKEAFILEMNLIQTHRPRYNIMLMDDSHYPYIALRKKDAFLKIARRKEEKGYRYFGPFPSSRDAYKTIGLLNKVYPTRKCRNLPNKPCLYYHLGQCLAPCINKIDDEVYEDLYQKINAFLEGDASSLIASLKKKMDKASEELKFEEASSYRDLIKAIKATIAKQRVELPNGLKELDAIAFAERDGYISLSILTYRNGMLLGKKNHVVSSFDEGAKQAIELSLSYYSSHEAPKLIASRIEGLKDEFLSIYPEIKVEEPKEGRLSEIIDMASLNAKDCLDKHFLTARLYDDNEALLEELGGLLHIKTPYEIELFDNSHLQGSNAVASLVVYTNGEPNKGKYRKYHLSDKDAGDDYHSMKEVTYRRYKRLKESNLPYPDLILSDGGLTQVRATQESLDELEVDIPVYGLYKNDKHQTEGIIDKEGNIYPIDSKSPLFFLLMRMQDEVHRFAIKFHREQRGKNMSSSIFDGIEGIGDKRKETLRRQYPNIDSLLKASKEELGQFLPKEVAERLYKSLHEEE